MNDAIEHLKQSIAEGNHWYIALLEAIGLWTIPEEDRNGHRYRYLIGGEAFDWLLLAQRLCEEVDDLIPVAERDSLLFGKPPFKLPVHDFKTLIGAEKYRALLNYFYGITVEQALHLAVQMDMEKEAQGHLRRRDTDEGIYQRIYNTTKSDLVGRFRIEKNYPQNDSMSLSEMDEFTYWLFKYRFNRCDAARVASDTKKALALLEDFESSVIER